MRFDNTEETSAWLEKAKQGDSDAFGKIWSQFEPLLRRAASRYLQLAEDIPDVLQNAAIKAWKALPEFDNNNLRGWLMTIAANEARTYARSNKTAKAVAESHRLPWDDGPSDLWQSFLQAHRTDGRCLPSSEKACSAQKLAEHAVSLLPESFRRTFQLSALGEYDYKEIAEELECPVNTVGVRLHKARNILRDKLEPYL